MPRFKHLGNTVAASTFAAPAPSQIQRFKHSHKMKAS
jgi:hypothetical protein